MHDESLCRRVGGKQMFIIMHTLIFAKTLILVFSILVIMWAESGGSNAPMYLDK